jgi:hypothetical protein
MDLCAGKMWTECHLTEVPTRIKNRMPESGLRAESEWA